MPQDRANDVEMYFSHSGPFVVNLQAVKLNPALFLAAHGCSPDCAAVRKSARGAIVAAPSAGWKVTGVRWLQICFCDLFAVFVTRCFEHNLVLNNSAQQRVLLFR